MGLYFLQKMQAGHSQPTIDETFFAVKFYHISLLNNDPCQHSLVKNKFQAAKRLSNHKTKKKKSTTTKQIEEIYDHLSANQSSLENLRLLINCLIVFTGFMRLCNVTSIKDYDIIFTETCRKIFIEKSKTDICREGSWVYISQSHNMCPVKHLEDYLRLVNSNISSSQYILNVKHHDHERKINLSHTLRFAKIYQRL